MSMSKDDIFDKKIKERLQVEMNNVPDNINEVFDKALNKCSKHKRFKFKKITGILAACLTIVLIFGITASTYASNIPVLKNIFETFKLNKYENYDIYASDINITKENKGIKITINKVIYDGLDLELFYTLESEESMDKRPDFKDIDIKINGKEANFGYGGGGELCNDNKTYVGTINYSILSKSMVPEEMSEFNETAIDIPEQFMLNIKFNQVKFGTDEKFIKGKWTFDIPVSNESTRGKVKEYDTEVDLNNIQKGLKVNKIITTPINTVIQILNRDNSENILDFIAFDNKGRCIEPKSSHSSGRTNEDEEYMELKNVHFKELYEDTKSITFIPYHMIFNKEQFENNNQNDNVASKDNISSETKKSSVESDILKVKLNLNGETKLTTNEGKDYGTITKVEVLDDKTNLYYKPTLGNYNIFQQIDNNQNANDVVYPVYHGDNKDEIITKYINETGEFVVQFNKPLTSDDYTLSYYDRSKIEVYYFDKSFTLNVSE